MFLGFYIVEKYFVKERGNGFQWTGSYGYEAVTGSFWKGEIVP